MNEAKHRGRVTIPTDVDVVPETLEILERWGADAIRDCEMCIRDRACRHTAACDCTNGKAWYRDGLYDLCDERMERILSLIHICKCADDFLIICD